MIKSTKRIERVPSDPLRDKITIMSPQLIFNTFIIYHSGF